MQENWGIELNTIEYEFCVHSSHSHFTSWIIMPGKVVERNNALNNIVSDNF